MWKDFIKKDSENTEEFFKALPIYNELQIESYQVRPLVARTDIIVFAHIDKSEDEIVSKMQLFLGESFVRERVHLYDGSDKAWLYEYSGFDNGYVITFYHVTNTDLWQFYVTRPQNAFSRLGF